MSLTLELRHDRPLLDFAAEIPEGRITALAGPSGSGKTSILRAIAGLLRLNHARVRLGAQIWSNENGFRPTCDRPIGYVSQHYGLFPHLTVQGNVETALLHLPEAERWQRAANCIRLVYMAGLEDRYPHELSGGQKQRAALARAIARNPQVLLLDEPFSAVDRSTRKRLYEELLRLHRQLGMTVVLVTHDLDEAAQLASHLVLLHHGQLVQAGPTTEVLTRPASGRAARLLDIPNIFSARIETEPSGRTRLLRWGPHALQIIGDPASDGAAVRWTILPVNVLLARPDKSWGGHLENLVSATVADVLELGVETQVWLQPAGLEAERLQMRLPTRAVRRYALTVGQTVPVSLRADEIVVLNA